MLIARKCVRARKNVTTNELVIVNEYGIRPTRFARSSVLNR
jgi:hypothetical protein